MAYTSNPYAPKARRLAVNLVKTRKGNCASVARLYGVHRSTVGRWLKKATKHSREFIDTVSSRPKFHPNQTPQKTVNRSVELRLKLGRCAPVIHAHLLLEGYEISLPTVSRILKRKGLIRKKKQSKYYTPLPRPEIVGLGSLVQADTIHFVRSDTTRFYIYTVIDTYSRLAHAEYHAKLGQKISYEVIKHAQERFGFKFLMVQTDHGPEFRDGLDFELRRSNISLRHSRVRKPNDNAHLERFNRTLQEECFEGRYPKEKTVKQELESYLEYYNNYRLHLSLNLLTPAQFVAKVLI